MNKKILGISIAMLFASSGALAQTSVTLYGTVDAGIAYNKGSSIDGKSLSLESGQQSYSRIGFRGTEDLGGGVKALFLLEQGVQIDTGDSGYQTLGSNYFGSNGTFSSQAYIGLNSDLGTLKLGRQFSPLYEAYAAIDPFQNGFAGGMNNFFGNFSSGSLAIVIGTGSLSSYQRMSNAVVYNTADNLGGFKGSLAYGFGEVPGHTSSGSQIGASLGYANGPLTVAYAYHRATPSDPASDNTFSTHFIGATYDFEVAKVHAAFDQNKVSDVFKTQDYMIGVTVPMGSSAVFANYTQKKDKTTSDADANQFAIGYIYDLSKRTNLYTAYTYVKNDANSAIDTDTPNTTVNTFQVGVRHTF